MTAKEYLSQAETARKRIRQINDRIKEIRMEMEHPKAVRYDTDLVQNSPSDDAMANYMIRLEKEEKKLLKAKNKYLDLRDEICRRLKRVTPDMLYDILYKRYIEEKKLALIADEMNYSYEWTCRLHGKALREFTRLFPSIKRGH